jgi:hypothetical protein
VGLLFGQFLAEVVLEVGILFVHCCMLVSTSLQISGVFVHLGLQVVQNLLVRASFGAVAVILILPVGNIWISWERHLFSASALDTLARLCGFPDSEPA